MRGLGWLLLLPVGLFAVAIGGETMMAPAMPMTMRLVGKNSRVCMLAIPAMSLPLLAGALFGLRHGAPSHPHFAGALAGLLWPALPQRSTPRTAPTTRRCSSRPGTRSRRHS